MLQYRIKSLGNTLIEVLVALLLLSSGLLLAGILSIKALQLSRESLLQAKALVILEDAKESLLKNSSFFDLTSSRLQEQASQNLPQGTGYVVLAHGQASIHVCWHSMLKHEQQQLSLQLTLPNNDIS